MKNIVYTYIIFNILVLFNGCSSMRPKQYPDVIYNHRQPLVSVTYEYGEIDIEVPLVFPGLRPDELSFALFSNGDSLSPLLTVRYQITDKVKLFLPQGVLGTEVKNNFIKITPHHSDFISMKVPFLGVDFGSIILDPVYIVQEPLNIAGVVTNNQTGVTLANIDVSLFMMDELLQKVFSNDEGVYSITIPGEYKDKEYLRIVAGEKLIFSPFRKDVNFFQSKDLTVNIGLGPSKGLSDIGNLYITNKENVHFRDAPNIGGETLFLLPKGEPVAVKQVSKGLYYGTIEVAISSGKNVNMSGWLEREDTDLLFFDNIFKDEYEDEQPL